MGREPKVGGTPGSLTPKSSTPRGGGALPLTPRSESRRYGALTPTGSAPMSSFAAKARKEEDRGEDRYWQPDPQLQVTDFAARYLQDSLRKLGDDEVRAGSSRLSSDEKDVNLKALSESDVKQHLGAASREDKELIQHQPTAESWRPSQYVEAISAVSSARNSAELFRGLESTPPGFRPSSLGALDELRSSPPLSQFGQNGQKEWDVAMAWARDRSSPPLGHPESLPPLQPAPASMRSPTPTEADAWRKAFHAEAGECVKRLEGVFNSASLSHFASRFEDWRKVDMKATAQMQGHIKQLAKLNDMVESFLNQSATPDGLRTFRVLMDHMHGCSDRLTRALDSIDSTVESIAERAATKVLERWQSEIAESSQLLRSHCESQRQHWHADEEYRSRMTSRVEEAKIAVSESGDEVQRMCTQLNVFSESQSNMADASRQQADTLLHLDERITALVTETLKDLSEARILVEDMEKRVKNADAERELETNAAVSAKAQLLKLEDEARELRLSLEKSEEAVEEVREHTLPRALKRIQEIETRGFMTVNRQTGQVLMKHPIIFKHTPAGKPPQFAERGLATRCLSDLARILQVFDLPVLLEVKAKPPRGQKPDTQAETLQAQADYVAAELRSGGVKEEILEARGVATVAGEEGIVVQLDKSLFPVPEVAVEAKKAGKKTGGRAPTRSPSPKTK